MVIIEQFVYGVDPAGDSHARTVLATSPGMGREVAAEIQRFCDGWGQVPALGLQHPALLSLPLEGTMPALRGRLYAVIRLEKGDSPIFHAAVLSEPGYAAFGYNPYALAGSGFFEDGYAGMASLPRREMRSNTDYDPACTPVSTEDVGLVDEALHWLLAEGILQLPIEQALGESDRALALILAALPTQLRKNQRFASFCTSDYNGYTLAARETPESSFAGWKRWFMAQPTASLDTRRSAYVRKVRDCLAAGNLADLSEIDFRLEPSGASPLADDAAGPSRPTSLGTSTIATTVGDAAPPARSRVPGPSVRNDVYRPSGTSTYRSAVGRSARAHPAAVRSIPAAGINAPQRRSRAGVRPRLVSNPVRISQVGNRKLPVPVAMTVVLAAASLAAYLWLSHGGQDGGFGWAVLKDHFASRETGRTTSLLEVVNVGRIYDRQVKRVTRSGLGGLGEAVARDRSEALAELQLHAAAPLQQQAEIYLGLAENGIQQGNRPDREIRRLESLAAQGDVLLQEMSRLEMAWYSLAVHADWRDLGGLPDAVVKSRRDSLLAASPRALADARRELGTDAVRKRLSRANEQMQGMQDLLTLFHAEQWSEDWERRIYRAAERVSPAASGMTRAYRNAAFVVVRLKKAERTAAHRELPFAEDFQRAAWPSPQVQDVLPSLRRQVQKFREDEAPPLLDGVATLYAYLGKPQSLAGELLIAPTALDKLENNPAYRFDPGAYADYLDRVRFEVADSLLVQQADEELLPDGYFVDEMRQADGLFRDALAQPDDPRRWEAVAAADGPSFFVRWAVQEAKRARRTVAVRQGDFDAGYARCVRLLTTLRESAAAGGDWTVVWLDLRQETQAGLGPFGPAVLEDRVRAGRRERLQELQDALGAERPLSLTAVTVRLDQDATAGPPEVVLKLTVEPGGTVLVSDPIPLGPASPAGSGWVGTGSLDWRPPAGADSSFRVEIVTADTGNALLQTQWSSLAEGAGPGVLVRPAEGETGSVKFRVDASWWTGLQLPDLE